MGQPKWLIGTLLLFLFVGYICYTLEGQFGGTETNHLNNAMNAGFSYTGVLESAQAFWQCFTWNFSYLHDGIGVYLRLFLLAPISIALAFEFGAILARLVIPWAT